MFELRIGLMVVARTVTDWTSNWFLSCKQSNEIFESANKKYNIADNLIGTGAAVHWLISTDFESLDDFVDQVQFRTRIYGEKLETN